MKRYVIVFLLMLRVFMFADITINVSSNSETAVITVDFEFPDERYQQLDKDFFKVVIDSDIVASYSLTYEEPTAEKGFPAFAGATSITVQLDLVKNLAPGSYPVQIQAHYQLCDEFGVCFFPEVETHTIQYAHRLEEQNTAESISFPAVLLLILFSFAGGIILNFMPCVLPLLSIKAMGLVQQAGDKSSEIKKSGIFYTAGILFSMLVLASFVVILQLSGQAVGWGFQFQNPVYVLSLIVILFVFSLALFDVFHINLPGMNAASKLTQKKGQTGNFLTGIVAVLLSTPCSAPLLGSALGFAFASPPLYIFISFIFIGLGLALPFLLIGFVPQIVRYIPKPGKWMSVLKELLGFLLLGTALHLLSVLYHIRGGGYVIQSLIFLFVVGAAAWLFGTIKKSHYTRKSTGVALLLALVLSTTAAVYLFTTEENSETIDQQGTYVIPGWERFDKAEFEAQKEDTIMFLAIGAKWCLTCKTTETILLSQESFIEAMTLKNVRLVYADFTNPNDDIAAYIRKLGRAGVPVYALFFPGQEPVILPELLSQELVLRQFSDKP